MKNSDSLQITTPSDREVRLTRTFAAPRPLVFDAFSKPELLKRWLFGPDGWSLAVCDIDFRPGGKWRFVVRKATGEEYAFRGEVLEVVAPEKFVWTFEYEGAPGAIAVETHTFVEQDGKTILTVVSRYDSIEARDAVAQPGMAEGAAEMWDRLDEMLTPASRA